MIDRIQKYFDSSVAYWMQQDTPRRRELIANSLPDWFDDIGGKLLDIGCGTGIASSVVVKQGYEPTNIICIDISEKMLEASRKNIPNANFILAQSEHLPMKDNSIRRTIIFDAIPHMDISRTIAELSRVMMSRGELVILHDNCHYRINEIHNRISDDFAEHKLPPIYSLVEKLREYDFSPIKFCEIPNEIYFILAERKIKR